VNQSRLTLSAVTRTKSCLTFLFNSLWFRHKHIQTRTRQLLLSFHFSFSKYSHVCYNETLHTTLFTQLIYFSYCIWTCKMIMAC